MDEQTIELMNRQTDGWRTEEWRDRQTDRTDRPMNRWKDRRRNKETGEGTRIHMKKQRQMKKQIDR